VAWFGGDASAGQLLAQPAPSTILAPNQPLTLTFSTPVESALGSQRPRLTPNAPGRWRVQDSHTLVFQPSGLGFPLDELLTVVLPRPTHLAGRSSAPPVRTLHWQTASGSTMRLQQVLAQLGYLPLDWRPRRLIKANAHSELAAALKPPTGRFSWRYPNTPTSLRRLWHPGRPNTVTRAAVMTFEHDHHLTVDGIAGPDVWRALIDAALAGRRHNGGYSYVFVHRAIPQSLNLWHNGQIILTSPGNTGVPAAPTQLGSWPVFEHIPVGTMSGTNPDGTHYHDTGIRYISYFHRGDAIHAFNRASFGTPQSLGCVELPLPAAAKAWPYTPIGTLVTIEN
jgi:peptidoglycan hydrolase-like protein with peptidoglycan-binding domain